MKHIEASCKNVVIMILKAWPSCKIGIQSGYFQLTKNDYDSGTYYLFNHKIIFSPKYCFIVESHLKKQT